MDVAPSLTQPDRQQSKFGLRHAIKLDQFSCMNSSYNSPIILIYFKNQTFQKGCPRNCPAVQRCKTIYWYFRFLLHKKKREQSDIGGESCFVKHIFLFAKYTVHYKIDYFLFDSVDFVWRLLCTFIRGLIERGIAGGKVKILKRRPMEIAI